VSIELTFQKYLAKDLENAKKREEKYKGDLEVATDRLAVLEKEHVKVVKEREVQAK